MLNEQEREDGPEEGEYHFSDEGHYESGEEEAKAPVVTESSGLAAKFSSYRRFVIIGGIAAGVFLIAYLAIPPLTTSTPTEITAVTTSPPVPTETVVVQSPAPAAAPASVSAPIPAKNLAEVPKAVPAANQPLTKELSNLISEEKEKIVAEKEKVMAHFTSQQPVAPAATMPAVQPSLPSQQPARQVATESVFAPVLAGAPPSIVSPMAQDFIAAPMGTLTPGPAAQASAENKAALDRLTAMEETNTKLIGQLHAEYAQKVADYEAQNKTLQEQVRTLNARLAGMETELSKLVQALNNKQTAPAVANEIVSPMAENTSVTLPGSPSASAQNAPVLQGQGGYKSNYTVQAIIPGRAWLRTEGGETITVAEGDMLKSLGRVTKIDPYDGTILIDTGVKVITLTYGNGDYA